MKKLLDRLRRWLIKKLGGYPEPSPFLRPDPPMLRQTTLDIQTIYVTGTVRPWELDEVPDQEVFIKQRLAGLLVEELAQSRLVSWKTCAEPWKGTVEVSATLCVVKKPTM